MANIKVVFIAGALLLSQVAAAITSHDVADIFKKISENLKSGNIDTLTEHFQPTINLQILAVEKTCSIEQATLSVKDFFDKQKPSSFTMLHIGSKANKYYGIGLLTSKHKRFRVTVFLLINERNTYTIQQLRIEHEN